MGDREKASLRLQFNPQIRLELHGATITSDAGLSRKPSSTALHHPAPLI